MDFMGAPSATQLLDQASVGAEQAQLRQLEKMAPGRETREGLEKTAREFEAVFMNTLMKAMRKTVPDNKLYNSGGATKFYRQMHDAEIAKSMATGGSGLGIADLIIQQFAKNVESSEAIEQLQKENEGLQSPVGAPAQPLPIRTEVFGPPAPHQQSEAMSRYRSMSPVGERVAKMARLRAMASQQGAAVADTLQRFEHEIGSASVKSGLDPELILAVVMEESGGDPQARSPKGATGLMQLMPGTAAEVGVSDATSPSQNLHGGSAYLAQMLRKYEGKLDIALAAYNAGPGNVDKAGGQIPDFKETQRYVKRVLERYEGLGGGTNLANSHK